MSKQNLSDLLGELNSINAKDVKKPSMPVEVFIQEAFDQMVWAQSDIDQLTEVGMSRELFDSIPARVGAASHAQSIWMRDSKSQKDNSKLWDEKAPQALKFRDNMIRSFRYAFGSKDNLLRCVREISKGVSRENMIQDLSDLAVLGSHNTKLLKTINFDITQLDAAAALADEMALLLAAKNKVKLEKPHSLDIRNRAYIYLKMAHDEVKRTARFVFRGNKQRLLGYRSEFKYQENIRVRKPQEK